MAKNNATPPDGQGVNQPMPPDGRMQFKRVTRSFRTAGGARRGDSKLTIRKSGASRSNSEGKEEILRWVRDLGYDHTKFSVTFGGNEEAGTMAIYYATEEDPSAMPVTLSPNALQFHCGECFRINPLLRPTATVDCSFAPGFDADNIPCLIVNISGGTPTRKVKRPEKQPKPQEEKKDEKTA